MRFESDRVVILTRTVMSGGVCVGAYDLRNGKMIRLLGPRANRLTDEAPYQVGEVYSMVYAERYGLEPPHTEDVAVYEAFFEHECDCHDFDRLIDEIAEEGFDLTDLFDGKLHWEGHGFVLPDDPPNYSVQIVTLNCDLVRNGDYFEQVRFGVGVKRIKYCSGQAIPDSGLSFFSATAGGSPSLA